MVETVVHAQFEINEALTLYGNLCYLLGKYGDEDLIAHNILENASQAVLSAIRNNVVDFK